MSGYEAVRAIRVAHVLPIYSDNGINFFGGGERYVVNLARALSSECDVTLYTFGPRYTVGRVGGVRHVVLPALRRNAFNPIPKVPFLFLEKFDVVHAHQLRTIVTSMLAVFANKRVVGTDLGGRARSPMDRLKLYRFIPRFIAISEFSKRLMPDDARARTVVVRGGLDLNRFGYQSNPRLRQVLQIGRIMPHKGMNYSIEAAGHDISLVIAGRIADEEYYLDLQRLAVGRPVRFLIDPPDEVIDREYALASVTIAASVYRGVNGHTYPNSELLGLTMLESMAVGTPVVCTAVGGMPEYVIDGVTGFIVPPNDSAALRERVEQVLGDQALARRMGTAGCDHVQQFSWEKVAEQVLAEYTRLRSGKGAEVVH